MPAHLQNMRHIPRVVKRLEKLLDLVRRYPGLSTVEYAEASWGRRGWSDANLYALLRSDLDRLWGLGLVAREKNEPLAREDGFPSRIWYWYAIPIEGQVGGYTVTVRERIAAS
jgi:hypothetical protein